MQLERKTERKTCPGQGRPGQGRRGGAGPRGEDNGDFYWQDHGVWLVGLGASKKPSNTNAIVAMSNQRFELNGKTKSKLLLNATLAFTKDGALKFTGSCVKSLNDKAKCEVGDGNVRSLIGVHAFAFP